MIAFYGASVTKQINGYAARLKKMLPDKVKIFAYGGMHLNNAGICFIDEVLKYKPEYCFVDWFSTGNIVINDELEEYINTIVYKFSEAGCKLVFLFLPHYYIEARFDYIVFCKQKLDLLGIYYIDINEHLESLDGILKDEVHTTQNGSKKYAEIIYDKFLKNKEKLTVSKLASPTRFTKIKKVSVERVFEKKIVLRGHNSVEIIGFHIINGPHAGYIEFHSSIHVVKQNIWDRWCYYYRDHFDIPNYEERIAFNGKANLYVLQEKFDTSTCRHGTDFSNIRKAIMVKSIYYLGDFLIVENMDEGKRIPYLKIKIVNIVSRFEQVLKMFKRLVK